MRRQLETPVHRSEFRDLGVEYFDFEEDFVEDDVRCIPMIVRFKMDAAGIKLKLAEWVRFETEKKKYLALKACASGTEISAYRAYLQELVKKSSGAEATHMVVDQNPAWTSLSAISADLQKKAAASGWHISATQWKQLSDLQRFVLLKLCRPGHEDKNFPKAMKEFGLVR
ncbi:MAG: nitrate reductase associated protein [Chitinophagaceae bacterium]|nr:nitrate reductase associated protein [Chitinophagaceae bacterium]